MANVSFVNAYGTKLCTETAAQTYKTLFPINHLTTLFQYRDYTMSDDRLMMNMKGFGR
jgi:hypothetical protein